MSEILSTKETSAIFLAFILIAGTITTVSIYGQSSNAPFVTENELQAALASLINSANTYHVVGTPIFVNGRPCNINCGV